MVFLVTYENSSSISLRNSFCVYDMSASLSSELWWWDGEWGEVLCTAALRPGHRRPLGTLQLSVRATTTNNNQHHHRHSTQGTMRIQEYWHRLDMIAFIVQTRKHVWQWRTCVTRCARPGCRCWCGRWWRWRRRGPATASPCCWGRTSTSPAQCTTSTSWPTGTRTKLPSIIRWVNSFQQRGTCDKILLSWVKFQFSYLTSLGWFWPQRARDDYQWEKYWPDILWDILCTKWWDMRPQQDRNCTRPLLPAGFPQSFTRKS